MIRITAAEMNKIRSGNKVILKRTQNKALRLLRQRSEITVYTGFPPDIDKETVHATFRVDKTLSGHRVNYGYLIEVSRIE